MKKIFNLFERIIFNDFMRTKINRRYYNFRRRDLMLGQ